MRPNKNPGGATGAGEVNLHCNQLIQFSRFFLKYQALCRLFLLTLLIPYDGHFEPELSLAIDRALVGVEGAAYV